jgi:hypothetical protein
VFASYTLAFALQLRKKHGKILVRVAARISQADTAQYKKNECLRDGNLLMERGEWGRTFLEASLASPARPSDAVEISSLSVYLSTYLSIYLNIYLFI